MTKVLLPKDKNNNSLKLFKVNVAISPSATTDYSFAYVVSTNFQKAGEMYIKYLEENDIGFSRERYVKSVELIAEMDKYPKNKIRLFIDDTIFDESLTDLEELKQIVNEVEDKFNELQKTNNTDNINDTDIDDITKLYKH